MKNQSNNKKKKEDVKTRRKKIELCLRYLESANANVGIAEIYLLLISQHY